MKTCAAYIRVSTDEQMEHSPESQLKELKDYANRHDLIIDPAHVYIDAGVSGRKAAKRPQFQRMIAAARNDPRPFDAILVWKFSRFARNQEESILYKSLLRRECDVDVISITETTTDNVFGSLIERIIEWMDEFYSIRLGEEVRTKMTFVAEKGINQTAPSFGFRINSDGEKEIIQEEARWVIFMRDQLFAGKSLRYISDYLNDHGVRTRQGNRFEPRTVEYILRNMANAGAAHWTPNQDDHDSIFPYSENTIIVKDVWPAIYSFESYEKIIAEFDRRSKLRKKYAKPDGVKKHWLSGILKCANCGASMVYSQANNGFQCSKYGKSLCKISNFISATKIVPDVITALENIVITDSYIKSITIPVVNDDEILKNIKKYEGMLRRANKAYVEGIDTLEEYAENKRRLNREIENLKKEAASKMEYKPKEEVEAKFKSIIELLKSDASNDVKRDALAGIVEKITYSRVNDSVEIFLFL